MLTKAGIGRGKLKSTLGPWYSAAPSARPNRAEEVQHSKRKEVDTLFKGVCIERVSQWGWVGGRGKWQLRAQAAPLN
jgi:hypothetical protein